MSITRLFEIPEYQQKQYPQEDALAFKVRQQWSLISTDTLIELINAASRGLMELGIGKGDRVALVSSNRPEWIILDYAIQQIGAVSVPLYPTITIDDYRFILNDSGAIMVFAENQQLFQKVKAAAKELKTVRHLYTFDEVEEAGRWDALVESGKQAVQHHQELISIKNSIIPDEVVTIIYTSGTTGNPKGVMLTHKNILSNAIAVAKIFPAEGYRIRTLSFLPLCHIFERTASFMASYIGVSIYFAESLDTIGQNLVEVKPHYFSAVPRLLEKTYEKIMDKGMALSGFKKKLFNWAVSVGERYQLPYNPGWGYRLQLSLANKLVFSKWREALGGNMEFIVSGAAALHSGISRMFWAAKIPILEAYGLTETSPGVCFTRLDYQTARIGHVGYPLEDVNIKIAPDGEILVKGPNVMKGYFQRPDLTKEVIDDEGWLHTGDIGEISGNNLLKITDRKKEIFKTSGGKYIAPQVIENFFKESPYIDQMMVVGEGQKFPAALIVPSTERLKQWLSSMSLTYSDHKDLVAMEKIQELFKEIVDKKNQHFAQYEKIKKFRLIPDEWGVDSGELTPTLKLKRRVIAAKYQGEIQAFYQ